MDSDSCNEDITAELEKCIGVWISEYDDSLEDYMRELLLHSRHKIDSALEKRTQVLGNYMSIEGTEPIKDVSIPLETKDTTDEEDAAFVGKISTYNPNTKHELWVFPGSIPFEEQLPGGSSYVTILSGFRKDDDSKFRFVPYFGDYDNIRMDPEAYDLSEDAADAITTEIEYIIFEAAEKFGSGCEVFTGLSPLLQEHFGIDAPPKKLQETYKDIVGCVNGKMAKDVERLNTMGTDCDASILLESYEGLFCRRCYKYDCYEHGLEQPRKVTRVIPPDESLQGPAALVLARQVLETEASPSSGACGDSCFRKDFEGSQNSVWTEIEMAFFRKLFVICGGDYCSLSALLGTKTCAQAYRYAEKLQLIDSEPQKRGGSGSFRPRSKAKKKKTLGLPKSVCKSNPYVPCSHEGQCSEAHGCICVKNKTYCEKYCGCGEECRERFSGCRCKGACVTTVCPCVKAERECDPDVCMTCESSCVSAKRACRNVDLLLKRRKHIILGRSGVHGYGAFAKEDIDKHELVSPYLGEIISQIEADRRGQMYDKLNRSYLFNIDEANVVDAAYKGSKIKFANHSYSPNCVSRVMTSAGDHCVGIYAKKAIKAGEELFFNYNHGTRDTTAPAWMKKRR